MLRKSRFMVLAVIAALLSISIVASAETKENEAFKFRGYEWGTPLEEIKAKEIKDGMAEGFDYSLREEEKGWVILDEIASVNVFTWFIFDDDWKLDYGYYVVNENHQTNSEYYSDFVRIWNALTSLYGDVTSNFGVGFSANGSDDLSGMTRDEILPKLENSGCVQIIYWTANDGSMIFGSCYAVDGSLRVEYYYFQDYSQFDTLINSSVSTEGL